MLYRLELMIRNALPCRLTIGRFYNQFTKIIKIFKISFVDCRIRQSGVGEGLFALDTSAASTAVLLPTFVA